MAPNDKIKEKETKNKPKFTIGTSGANLETEIDPKKFWEKHKKWILGIIYAIVILSIIITIYTVYSIKIGTAHFDFLEGTKIQGIKFSFFEIDDKNLEKDKDYPFKWNVKSENDLEIDRVVIYFKPLTKNSKQPYAYDYEGSKLLEAGINNIFEGKFKIYEDGDFTICGLLFEKEKTGETKTYEDCGKTIEV